MGTQNIISNLFKRYINSFAGLPSGCRYGVALSFIESSLSGICFFLSFYFVKILHIGVPTAGLIGSCYAIGTACGGIVGGKLSDQLPPKLVTKYSLFIEGLAFFALINTYNHFLLMIIMFILGVSIYSFLISNNLWVIKECKNDSDMKLRSINILYVASNLGFGIAATIIILMSSYGFRAIFLFAGISLLLSSFSLHWSGVGQFKKELKSSLMQANDCESDSDNSAKLADKVIVTVVLSCLFLVGLIIAQRSAVYLIYVQSLFPASGVIGLALVFVLNPLLIVLFQTAIVNYFRNVNNLVVVGSGAFLMGAGMFMLTLSVNFIYIIMACVVYTVGEMLFFSMAQFVCYKKGDENKKGQSLGIFKSVYAISIIVGPSLAGFIYHNFGCLRLWDLDGLFGLVCLVSCLYIQRYD